MADPFNREFDVGPPPTTLRQGKPVRTILTVIFLIIVGAGAALVWFNYDRLVGGSPSPAAAAQDSAAAPADVLDNAVSSKDFETFQQQTTTALQANTDALASQQNDLKRLSDQVAGLTAKIDAMQSNASAGVPAVARVPAVAPRPGTLAVPPRKRPAAPPKPAGAISVGGAPLPVQPTR